MTAGKPALALAVLILLFVADAAALDLSNLTLIRDVKLLASPEEIRVVVKADGKHLLLPSVKIINDRLLQLDIEKSYTEPAKRSFSISDPFLEKVDIYQMDPSSVRIRLHLLASFEKGRDSVWRKDGGFVLSLKRKPASSPLKKVSLSKVTSPPASLPPLIQKKEAEAVAGSAKKEPFLSVFNENIPLPDEEGKTVAGSGPYSGLGPIIRMLSSLAIVVGLLLLVAYIFKKKMLAKGGLGRGGLIKVIDRTYVDIKKGIAIVDVAGEIIVVGLSGDGITMLTKIEDEAALARVKKVMQKGDASLFSAMVDDASAAINTPNSYERDGSSSVQDAPSEESILERIKKLKPLR